MIDVVKQAAQRAKEVSDFLTPKIKLTPNEKLVIDIFYEDTQAALVVYAWILMAHGQSQHARPIGHFKIPSEWQTIKHTSDPLYVTVFGKFDLQPEDVEDIKKSQYKQIIYPHHMLSLQRD